MNKNIKSFIINEFEEKFTLQLVTEKFAYYSHDLDCLVIRLEDNKEFEGYQAEEFTMEVIEGILKGGKNYSYISEDMKENIELHRENNI